MVETTAYRGRIERAREELIANIMAVPAVLGLGIAIADFFRRDSGIAGTAGARSEERRVVKECLRLCRSRWSPYH